MARVPTSTGFLRRTEAQGQPGVSPGTAQLTAGLAGLGIGATVLGAGVEVLGLIRAGNAAQRRGDFQAAILRNNAKISRRAAEDALRRGAVTVQRAQTATGQFIGRQRAALAASGVLVDEGSAADLISDTARIGAEAVGDIQENAEREALQFQIDAMNFEANARMARFVGQQERAAARGRIAGVLLSSAGRLASIGVQAA